jgi:hypothetical protein
MAYADNLEEIDGKMFEEKKAKLTENIDKRISNLNEMKSCVAGAKDKSALKECRKKMKEFKDDMKEEWQDKKSVWKEKKKKK